jgi:hypothetical protein
MYCKKIANHAKYDKLAGDTGAEFIFVRTGILHNSDSNWEKDCTFATEFNICLS